MSYETAQLARVSGANSGAGAMWMYKSTDTIAVVIAADYISDGDARALKVDDIVLVVDATLNQVYRCMVSAVTSAGAATLILKEVSQGEVVITTNVITAAESGKTFFLTLAGGFTSTLPPPALGLKFKFIVTLDPTTSYIIVTDSGDNIMIGGINELEVDTSSDGPYINNGDTLNFVNALAVVGDYVEFESDGTSWFFNGQTNVDGGVTLSST